MFWIASFPIFFYFWQEERRNCTYGILVQCTPCRCCTFLSVLCAVWKYGICQMNDECGIHQMQRECGCFWKKLRHFSPKNKKTNSVISQLFLSVSNFCPHLPKASFFANKPKEGDREREKLLTASIERNWTCQLDDFQMQYSLLNLGFQH